ncbi:hypothetical protein CVT26_008335 [Gymnopilus dilepis]|uniref:Uncharacterized protein n=1 Tax=Gymnopilus dilepis TaxID=231916 RepID=A0A409XYA1_9AGAR|nr:hypothetical protein CVT26_008335 [Gymnopilus dilepis]
MESCYAYLLGNNDPPLQCVVDDLSGLIASPMEELALTNQSITNLELELRALKSKRKQLRSTALEEYLIITSPIRRLPDDILSEIFYQCIHSHRNPLMSASEAPVLLTRICSRWRSVALSSPELWARLHIPFCDNYLLCDAANEPTIPQGDDKNGNAEEEGRRAYEVLSKRVVVIKEWLERSGSRPLTLSLRYQDYDYDLETNTVSCDAPNSPTITLYSTLLLQSDRLQSLELNMGVVTYRRLESLLKVDRLLSLVEVKVIFDPQVSPPGERDGKNDPVLLFKAPHLRHLSLGGQDGEGGSYIRQFFPVPRPTNLAQNGKVLTYFYSNLTLTYEEGFDLLFECSNLISCQFRLKISSHDSDDDSTRFHKKAYLPNLTSFATVDECGDKEVLVRHFYVAIDAPNLEFFNYQFAEYPCWVDVNETHPNFSIVHLLRKAVQLKKLTIDAIFFDNKNVGQVLSALGPAVSRLVIGDDHMLPDFKARAPFSRIFSGFDSDSILDLGLLIVDQESTHSANVLLPNLQILEVPSRPVLPSVLVRILTSRMDATAQGRCSPPRVIRAMIREGTMPRVDEEMEVYKRRNMVIRRYVEDLKLDIRYVERQAGRLDPSYGLPKDSFIE